MNCILYYIGLPPTQTLLEIPRHLPLLCLPSNRNWLSDRIITLNNISGTGSNTKLITCEQECPCKRLRWPHSSFVLLPSPGRKLIDVKVQ